MDASGLQRSVDWARVAAAGNAFAFLRASEGVTSDDRYMQHREQAEAAGLLVGSYVLYRARHTPAENVAALTAQAGADLIWQLPPVLDLEAWDPPDQLPPAELAAHVREGLDRLGQAAGTQAILYVSPSFVLERLPREHGLGDAPLWLADYREHPAVPPGWDAWTFWQWTGHGRVIGDPGDADQSVYAGTIEQLRHLAGAPTAP